ncbi:MAG: DNA-3-methyladenine glycosylase I [Bacteroidetes bacterium]|nr:DNA-3-methyladenine glycosylase I [Bacteroidota bacterium]
MCAKNITRCSWPGDDELMQQYHDEEWGVPLYDDKKLFEFMVLDAFQAGLSWKTILHRREGFRKAFSNFDVKKVAKYDEQKIDELMQDASIIRHRGKIAGTVKNAQLFISLQKEHGSFAKYIWQFTEGKPIVNTRTGDGQIPATSKESDAMSKALKKLGFTFTGSTICYAFMQAAGMVNDHLTSCYRYKQVQKEGRP